MLMIVVALGTGREGLVEDRLFVGPARCKVAPIARDADRRHTRVRTQSASGGSRASLLLSHQLECALRGTRAPLEHEQVQRRVRQAAPGLPELLRGDVLDAFVGPTRIASRPVLSVWFEL